MSNSSNQEEDSNSYGYNWTDFNSTFESNMNLTNIYNSFQHTKAESINSYSYIGVYGTYPGDGYIFDLKGSSQELKNNLTLLKQMKWIDRQTRAIFIQMVTFNPNVNLFAYITILFEILPSGNMVNSILINPIKLYYNYSLLSILLIIYSVFMILSFLNQIKKLINLKFKYFTHFWNLIEISIISFSLASFSISFLMLNAKNTALKLVNYSSRNSIFKLRLSSDSNQLLFYLLGISCFLSTIKLIKILKFNRNILFFSSLLKICSIKLSNLSFTFISILFAYIQLMYLLYNDQTKEFRSFSSSSMTVFNILSNYITFLAIYLY
jgi:hypothetical protein